MIKTPVYSEPHGTVWEIYDANLVYLCSAKTEIKAKEIVSALNAQQPKCETCGGSGEVENPICKNCEYYPLGEACLSCGERAKIPCPNCPPATQTGGITGNMKVEKSSIPSRIDYEVIVARQAARIEELEKANRWIPVSEKLPEKKESDEVLFIDEGLVEGGEFKNGLFWSNNGKSFNNVTYWKSIILPSKAALGKETQNGQE